MQYGRALSPWCGFELGSPVSATGTAVQLSSNGQPVPPPTK